MTIRAKFKVESHHVTQNWRDKSKTIGTVRLQPVTSGSAENERFYEATPGGSIELSTVNHEVLTQLSIGKEFYIDFTEATPPT